MKTSTISNHSTKTVRAILGPTNTGKTHLALERMLAYSSGIIGFPLRFVQTLIVDIFLPIGYFTAEDKKKLCFLVLIQLKIYYDN